MAKIEDRVKIEKQTAEAAEKRLKERPSVAPDRNDPQTGWTAQQGYRDFTPSNAQPQRFAPWQLPDPEVARAAGFPVQEIPEHLVAEDPEDDLANMHGQVPEERVNRDGDQLLEDHPGDVPSRVAIKEGGTTEAAGGTDDQPDSQLQQPSKAASTDDWRDYLLRSGKATEADLEGKGRDDMVNDYYEEPQE